ncbi:MAG: pantetheine-phosphate adenylyltransferase [Candidatus Zixiibacteriota bacterium]
MTEKRKETKARIGVYAGAFDPFTNGHLSLVERAGSLFDQLIVAVAENTEKRCLFTLAERMNLAREALEEFKWVSVEKINGLTAEYARKKKATALVRGVRAVSDFEYEFQMALMNRKLARDVETVFLMPSLSWVFLSSTLVKDVARNGGDVSSLVPEQVNRALKKKFASN